MMNKYTFVFFVWLVLIAVFGTAGYLLVKPAVSQTLREKGIVTQGRVTALEPHNHRIVHYSYMVGGNTYSGVGHGGGGNPKFDDLSVGHPVRVVYDPTNPGESFMGWPEHDLQVNRAGAVFFAVVPPTLVALMLLFILFVVSRIRRSKPN